MSFSSQADTISTGLTKMSLTCFGQNNTAAAVLSINLHLYSNTLLSLSLLDEDSVVNIITSCKTSLFSKSRFIQKLKLAKTGGLL